MCGVCHGHSLTDIHLGKNTNVHKRKINKFKKKKEVRGEVDGMCVHRAGLPPLNSLLTHALVGAVSPVWFLLPVSTHIGRFGTSSHLCSLVGGCCGAALLFSVSAF